MNFSDIITTYLAELRKRAAQHLGAAPTHVVMGRPVHFVDDDAERDAQAESSLRQAAEAVGFTDIAFQCGFNNVSSFSRSFKAYFAYLNSKNNG